jgi:hypothetical protein
MYLDAHIGDIWRVDNAKAECQVKSDKAPIDQHFTAVAIMLITICWSNQIMETRSEGH